MLSIFLDTGCYSGITSWLLIDYIGHWTHRFDEYVKTIRIYNVKYDTHVIIESRAYHA